MTEKKLGYFILKKTPEEIKRILKLKEDTWFCCFTQSDLKEFKINPENKIWFAQNGTEQTDLEKHTPLKVEIFSNV